MKNNIHGPCENWCLVDGKCSKHFPKDFNEETSFNKNSNNHVREVGTAILNLKKNRSLLICAILVLYCAAKHFLKKYKFWP